MHLKVESAFWFSVIGQTSQLNVARLGMRVTDKDATPHLAELSQPLCYAQIDGMLFATFVTLLLAPVFLFSVRAGSENRKVADD